MRSNNESSLDVFWRIIGSFTIIEWMIIVAIVGILASVILGGIKERRRGRVAYRLANGTTVECDYVSTETCGLKLCDCVGYSGPIECQTNAVEVPKINLHN
jgi:hypothetical protein